MTVPLDSLSGLAFSSWTSAWRSIISSRSLKPILCLADMFTTMVSPLHSSGVRPCSANSLLTRSGNASGLSILLIATRIGTLAALAWLIASMVCGITPSSAATTSTTMSVISAPLARMAVKASWPGVSRNTTGLSPTLTE